MNKFKSLLMVGLLSAGCLNAGDNKNILLSENNNNLAFFAAAAGFFTGVIDAKQINKLFAHVGALSVIIVGGHGQEKAKNIVVSAGIYAVSAIVGESINKLRKKK